MIHIYTDYQILLGEILDSEPNKALKMNLVLGKVYGLITKILSTKENEVGVADVHISKEGIIDDNEWVVSVVQPDHRIAKYDIISKCQYDSARSSNAPPKIQKPQHYLDEGLITILSDSRGIILPKQVNQYDEASGTQETNSGSNEMIHTVTVTNDVVTKKNDVGVADVHISKQGIIEDNELVVSLVQPGFYEKGKKLVQPDHHISKDDIISKCQSKEVASTKKIGKTIRHYSSLHKILLVGEGDFSFSASLAKAFGDAANIVATSLDDSCFLNENYPSAATHIGYLRNGGGVVIHEVDATKMADHDLLCVSKFDRIIYNFPLAGFFKESQNNSLKRNRKLVRLFMMNAKKLLNMGGEIHITHKTSASFQKWNLENVAKQCRLLLIEDVEFKLHHYPGYHTKFGFGGNNDFNCYPSRTYKFGLSEHNGPVASFIQQTEPLPPFYKARSMLTLEETRRNEVPSSNPTALVAAPPLDIVAEQPPPTNSGNHRRRGRNGRGRGGQGRGRGGRTNNNAQQQQFAWSSQPAYHTPWGPWAPNWVVPPCPYRTAPWYSPATPKSDISAGLLGSRPQAYTTSAPSSVASYLMDIYSAMHTDSTAPGCQLVHGHPLHKWPLSSGYGNKATPYKM